MLKINIRSSACRNIVYAKIFCFCFRFRFNALWQSRVNESQLQAFHLRTNFCSPRLICILVWLYTALFARSHSTAQCWYSLECKCLITINLLFIAATSRQFLTKTFLTWLRTPFLCGRDSRLVRYPLLKIFHFCIHPINARSCATLSIRRYPS